jgi:transcription-repair coupling factor (superfamily II helicase)
MNLSGLLPLLTNSPTYQKLLDDLQAHHRGAEHTLPLLRAARPYVVAAIAHSLNQPLIIVTGRVETAGALVDALRAYTGDPSRVVRFPEPPVLFYERAPWPKETVCERLAALSNVAMLTPSLAHPPIVITSVRALMQRTLPPRSFRANMRTLKKSQSIGLGKTLLAWIGMGYERATVVEAPGQFSARGGILDIFPPASPYPIRIELFGEEIESLRRFDAGLQRSQDALEQAIITPASEAMARHGQQAAEHIRAWDTEHLPEDIASNIERDLAALQSGEPFSGIEFYLPYFYSEPASLLNYLDEDGLVVLDEPDEVADVWNELEEQAVQLRNQGVESGMLPPDYPLPYITWDEWADMLTRHKTLTLGGEQDLEQRDALSAVFAPPPRFGGQLKPVLDHITQMHNMGDTTVIVSRQAQRLAELWAERDNYHAPLTDVLESPQEHDIIFVQGALPDGWIFRIERAPSNLQASISNLHLLTDGEIFGWVRPQPRRRVKPRAITPEAFFSDLQPGDYVVHVEHGVGVFQGLVTLTVEGVSREYLTVQYAGADRLYVPIHQADRISKYIGAEDRPPALHRLGTAEWNQVKARAQAAAAEVAKELLDLYAARELVAGHAYAQDSAWQQELEAAFPYVETEDQLRAIKEVKSDLEKPRPMDRLICGDVGYGKTEVALRAAFKAVQDGKQVAVLVPTTVLAQQHFGTFQSRLAPFPVNVEMLSRFRAPKAQKAILERLHEGQVDILIGTHRLLQKDVQFKDLGLLIIDEEQRFGVTHKEYLKKMRTEVDVLTLTATPIPRTLYMSLTGVRDISTIDTPPEERLPVATYVGKYDDHLIRSAILRELDRGGQVYFVHNRVQGIEQVRRRLVQVVPEAKIAIGHGQLDEEQLEKVMVDFVAGRVDVLLCTSIIESGLDIPNANTLIVNRADCFGLAQLYQLRGRVGRGAARAYAYFLYDKESRLTEDARRRLETIREATELGMGYSIAMRDLEIRGAGELLGHRQSGHIAAVGFDLYTRLLARAVEETRAEREGQAPPPLPISSVTIDLPLAAYLPTDYVADETLRLQLYRRLGGLASNLAIAEMEQELQDRFGPLPEPTQNLMFQLRIKVLAQQAGVSSIGVEAGQIVLKADRLEDADRIGLQQRLGEVARVARRQVILPRYNERDWQTLLVKVLEKMATDAEGECELRSIVA